MKRFYLTAFAALALASCGTTGGGGIPSTPPAPANGTAADEQALTILLNSYDAFLDVVEKRVRSGAIKGTQAVQVKAASDRAWLAIQALKRARGVASATDYATLYSEAVAAVDAVKAAAGDRGTR